MGQPVIEAAELRKLRLLARLFPQFVYLVVAGIVAFKVITFYVGYFNQIDQIMK